MKKRILYFLTIALFTSGVAYAETYDLAAFLDAVKQQNNDLKLAEMERETATAQAREAKSNALPTVGLEAGYNRNLTEYYMYFDRSAFGGTGVAKAPFRRDNEYSGALALQQTLFNPSVGNAIEAAEQYRTMTDFVYDASLEHILAGSKKLYYQCLLLEQVLAVTESAETNALENFTATKLKYDNGQTSQLECLQAETRWRNAAVDTQKAGRNVKLAMNMLKTVAGIEVSRDISIEGSLDTIPEVPRIVTAASVMETRPDFQALAWEEKLRGTAVKAARNASKPTVTGTLAFSCSAQSDEFRLDEENKFWFAGVKLSVPLYTGGKIEANVRKARVELAKTSIRMEKSKQSISTELENCYLRIEEARLRIRSAESTLATAEKAFSIAETTTRDGLTTQMQLKDMRVVYDQSRINYFAAVYDYMEAYFDWELAVGEADR